MAIFSLLLKSDTWPLSRIVGTALLACLLPLYAFLGVGADLTWRNAWWDYQHSLFPRERSDAASAPAVVVAIDETSMARIHPWPWPRDYLGALVQYLGELGATAVAMDLLLQGPDAQSPKALADRFRALGAQGLADRTGELPDTDMALARVLKSVPTVLPVSGVRDYPGLDPADECGFKKPAVVLDPKDLSLPPGLPAADPPHAPLLGPANGIAAIDFEASDDFVVRRVPAVQRICGFPYLLLGPEAMRVAGGGFLSTVSQTWSGLSVELGDPGDAKFSFPAESDGSFWLHFGRIGETGRNGVRALERYISAAEVLGPGFDASRIAGKVVLVAVIDLGRVDERQSPLGDIIYGVEAHMQMIEMIVEQTFLRRFDIFIVLEILLLLVAGLAVIVMVPRRTPVRGLLAIAAGTVLTLLFSLAAFNAGYLLDLTSPLLGTLAVSALVVSINLIERDRARLKSELALQSARADRAFLQGELDAAARIQRALLPPTSYLVPERVDLACHIDPARTVGGDFYDHVLIEDRYLFFLVADVSGKGADASQFMLLSKTLWKSVALRTGSSLEKIQFDANAEITRENAAMMFVTGLVGVLDLETRTLRYSSAGHDAPILFGDNRPTRQVEDFSGPPAGLVETMEFPVGEITLTAGDRLCIFTDGVTEAMNEDGDLFGLDRFMEIMASAPVGLTSAGLVDHAVAGVATFTGTAEQSDDLTLMIISLP